jgi:hypothetical protein
MNKGGKKIKKEEIKFEKYKNVKKKGNDRVYKYLDLALSKVKQN